MTVQDSPDGWLVSSLNGVGAQRALDEATTPSSARSLGADVVKSDAASSAGVETPSLRGPNMTKDQYGGDVETARTSRKRSRRDAVNYAKSHTYNADYNPKYARIYDKNGNSNDCTNFVSQELWAEGWKMKTRFYRNSSHWWYAGNGWLPDTWSWSWSAADNHRQSTKKAKRAKLVNSYRKMSPGDVLQIDFGGNGVADHTAIVIEVTESNMYVAQHDINDAHRSYRMIRARNPKSRWYLWHYSYGR